jgi:carbamoyl-phosphate synthase large subunit
MFHWSAHREAIAGCGAIPVLNRTELIELCRDKWTFYQNVHSILGANAIDTSLCSDFSELKRMFGLPFLAKPRQGYAGRGIIKIADEKAFTPVIEKMGSVYMIQPIVGVDDEEYTVSAFCDGEGCYTARMALKRRLSAEGYTEKAETTAAKEFDPLLTRLCQHLRPIGPTNFQFRRHDDVFKLLEINPRISSATSIRTAFGYNEALMAVDFYREGRLPVQPVIRTGRAVRYAEDYIAYS